MIEIIGGPDRDRTDDLFHAMEARSQLRHRPTFGWLYYCRLRHKIRQRANAIQSVGNCLHDYRIVTWICSRHPEQVFSRSCQQLCSSGPFRHLPSPHQVRVRRSAHR